MKFSTVFSALVAALAATTLANPVPIIAEQRSPAELNTRIPPVYDDQKNYKAVVGALHSAGITPEIDKSYWFTLRWDLRDDADKDTSKTGILRQQIGAFHLAILVATYKEHPVKSGTATRAAEIKRDFEGTYYHTVIPDPKTEATEFLAQGFKVPLGTPKMDGITVLGGKPTTKYNTKKLKQAGEMWDEDPAHKIWDDKTNNCKTFTDYFQTLL